MNNFRYNRYGSEHDFTLENRKIHADTVIAFRCLKVYRRDRLKRFWWNRTNSQWTKIVHLLRCYCKCFKKGLIMLNICYIDSKLEKSFFSFINFCFYFILLYNTVLVLPYIDMNQPWVYMSSQSWTHLPPHIISLDHPHAPASSILYPLLNIEF